MKNGIEINVLFRLAANDVAPGTPFKYAVTAGIPIATSFTLGNTVLSPVTSPVLDEHRKAAVAFRH